MEEFLSKHASAVFALIGAFGTTVITLVVNWLMRRKEASLRLSEKLLDKRIASHEAA